MQYTGLNTNQDRQKFWEEMAAEKGVKTLQHALTRIDPTSAQVLTWHYIDGYPFQEITKLLNRSISIVRNHHNRGLFELQQYFLKDQAKQPSTFEAPSDSE